MRVSKEKEEDKRPILKQLLLLIVRTAVIAGAIYGVWVYVLTPYRISGNNMSPFVRDGDLGIFYHFETPRLNEIVLYKSKDGKLKVGRVVATEGQTVDFPQNGGFLVDGYEPSEEIPYETHKGKGVKYPIEVPKNSYFVLNDFRQLTDDSREYGCVKDEQVIGTLEFLFRRRGF